MSKYDVSFSPRGQRLMKKVPPHLRQQMKEAVEGLEDNPFPDNSKPLDHELMDFYSLRLDDYRIVYKVDEDACTVEIAGVAHRKEIYDLMKR